MIRRLKYKEIDFKKYRACLGKSQQYIFFAEQKYLEILIGENWEILVYDDYIAVMPVYVKKKMGIDFVLMPLQTQQLGIFSQKDNPQLNEKFLDFFKRHYHIVQYSFNSKNHFISKLTERANFYLPKLSYQETKKNYSVHRRRNVRITESLIDKISFKENADLLSCKDFFLKNVLGAKEAVKKIFFENMLNLRKNGFLEVFDLYFDNQLVSQAYILNTPDEAFLINFINDRDFLQNNTSSLLLDRIFQMMSAEKVFNFHGSSIPAIADFYKRFGALEQHYPILQYSKKQILKNFFFKTGD